MIARPMATRWRCPPESCFGRRSSSSSSPSSCAVSCDALLDLLLRSPRELEAEGDVLRDRHVRVERVVLEHHRDVAVPLQDVVDPLAADVEIAGRDVLEPGDHPQRGGLPAAGGPDEHEQLGLRDLERQLLDRLEPVREPLAELVQDDFSHVLAQPFSAPAIRPRMK